MKVEWGFEARSAAERKRAEDGGGQAESFETIGKDKKELSSQGQDRKAQRNLMLASPESLSLKVLIPTSVRDHPEGLQDP